MRSLDAFAKAIDTCVFCPKLCRFACPVAEAETRETVTPWGLMTRVDDVRKGRAPLDADSAELWAHCTGCRRCQAICKHDNPVADVMRAARAAAVQAELGRPALDAWARPKAAAAALAKLPQGTAIQLLVGDATDEVIRAALRLLRAAGHRRIGRPDAVTHSGVRALDAGRPGAFHGAVGAVAAALHGAETVVCLEAEDVLGLTTERPHGARAPEGAVIHLLDALEGLSLRPTFKGDALYLDDCRLAHGLLENERPRALLRQAVQGQVVEALMSGAEAGCCGAGAGYAACVPDGAIRVAEEAVAIAPDLPIITASARCAAHLRAALPDRQVHHWAIVVAGALQEKS